MTELMRLIVLLVVVAAAVTALASGVMWYGDEHRRIIRGLTKVLKGRPDSVLIARGRGRGVGLHLANRAVAVTWDRGGWCLLYRLNELMGAELLIDGDVRARSFRGEPRRSLERVSGSASEVSLRLIFDDPLHPDFEMQLWRAGDETRDAVASPGAAVQEANRWIASVDALFRRTGQGSAAAEPPPAAPPMPVQAQPPPPEDHEPDLFEDFGDHDEDN
jgi:hypothetical protein